MTQKKVCKMFRMNKKGAEMTIGTIVMIILALVVLVVLIFGFTSGWGNLWNNIVGFGGGQVNVQTVVQACQVACSTSGTYDYCTRERSVVFEKDKPSQNLKCRDLESRGVGLSACGNVDCSGSGVLSGKTCSGWSGGWKTSCATDERDTSSLVLASDKANHPNEICCAKQITCPQWSAQGVSCNANQYDITNLLITPDDLSAHSGQLCCVN